MVSVLIFGIIVDDFKGGFKVAIRRVGDDVRFFEFLGVMGGFFVGLM